MIVMAIMSFTVAIVLPNVRRQIDEAASQGAFITLQRQVTGFRAQAYHQNVAIGLVSSGDFEGADDTDYLPAESQFCAEGQPCPWSYKLTEPMTISAGGVCSAVEGDLLKDGKVAKHLESRPDCHFVWVRT